MRNMVRIVLAVVLCILVPGVHAEVQNEVHVASGFRTTWDCWYGGETSVICFLRLGDTAGGASVPSPYTGSNALPAIMHAIRHDTASLEDEPVIIPLHTIPFEMDSVRQLAQSVMCGRLPGCTVVFGKSYGEAVGHVLASRQG